MKEKTPKEKKSKRKEHKTIHFTKHQKVNITNTHAHTYTIILNVQLTHETVALPNELFDLEALRHADTVVKHIPRLGPRLVLHVGIRSRLQPVHKTNGIGEFIGVFLACFFRREKRKQINK